MDLAEIIYKNTEEFPAHEKFGLISQINNIAEGAGRGTDKEFINFLSIALASAFELET
jgi:four helix bundle protein